MLSAPIPEEAFTIDLPSRGVALDARIHHGVPGGAATNAGLGVIISHPYAPLGGDLHNNVVREVAAFFGAAGVPTLRYSMRGAGRSTGKTSWTAEAEAIDLVALIDWWMTSPAGAWTAADGTVFPRFRPTQVLLVGYSYGALISLPAARTHRAVAGLILVSPPARVTWALTAFKSTSFSAELPRALPKLVVMGDNDQFSSESSMIAFAAKVCGTAPVPLPVRPPGPPRTTVPEQVEGDNDPEIAAAVVQGANASVVVVRRRDHFWAGEEDCVVDLVEKWVRDTFAWFPQATSELSTRTLDREDAAPPPLPPRPAVDPAA
ncbi:hypothetical protein H9P43_004025 [Blastocladiella emersonii ATCC 22665]|nr:hypothetical protein H9P43_004025 [Blastocladiella emersonii ATCC 22665]